MSEKHLAVAYIQTYTDKWTTPERVMKRGCIKMPDGYEYSLFDLRAEEVTDHMLECIIKAFNMGVLAHTHMIQKMYESVGGVTMVLDIQKENKNET